MLDLFEKNDKLPERYTLRTIRKTTEIPEKCHHLQILLTAEFSLESIRGIYRIVGKEMAMMPKKNYLELALSLKKKGCIYYCTQCGERFSGPEYELYTQLFERAKQCGYNVWKLKELFKKCRLKGKSDCLKKIQKGGQIYQCPVSRVEAGFIRVWVDKDKLYDEAIRRFR